MAKQSGFLKRQELNTEDFSIKMQYTTKQFMIDTLQLALHESEGWGYERLMRLAVEWEQVRKEYQPVLEPRDIMCDVKQEHMQRIFERICAPKKIKPIPFVERYPYLKGVRYDKKY